MNLDYLDHLIPKRWILLLHYWLPFWQTPSDFYFESRSFVDEEVIKKFFSKDFPLEKFPDLVLILVKYAHTQNEKEVAKKLITEIFARKTKKTRLSILFAIFKKFNPEDNNRQILEEVFRHIPEKLYFDYFNSLLKGKNCSSQNLKWYAYFKNKFSLKDRLTLCLSLPDDKLIANQATLSKLVIDECEEKFMLNFDLSLLNDNTTDRLLNIIFTNPSSSIFSNNLLRSFVNQLLKKTRELKKNQDSTVGSYIRSLDVVTRHKFFKNFLALLQNQENIEYFLCCCQDEQWSTLIDRFIVFAFNAENAGINNGRLTEKNLIVENPNLFLLIYVQNQAERFPVNHFQFLAIQYLSKQTFDLEVFKKAFSENHGGLKVAQSFSLALQSSIAEHHISAIKSYIREHIMIHVPKENKRQDIHHIFKQFYSESYNKFPNIAALILEKLPEDHRSELEADLNFLQPLLSQLYLILENPSIVNYKNQLAMEEIKSQIDYEEKTQASRELLLRIREGSQTRVSHQRMQELFGEKSSIMQEKWAKLGIHFFDAQDKEELAQAKKEAEEMRKINRECNTLFDSSGLSTMSALSTSPSIVSYLTF